MVCRPTQNPKEADGELKLVDCGVTSDVTTLACKFGSPTYINIDIVSDFTS
jgi:hypothetical protein